VRLLLDTHVALWALVASPGLGETCTAAITSGDNDVYVSAVSVAEVAIKSALGKLRDAEDFVDLVEQAGFTELALTAAHADQLRTLPMIHRDPFDRMLLVQAQVEGLTFVTADAQCTDYDVRTMEARR